jgi:hypothetical protein
LCLSCNWVCVEFALSCKVGIRPRVIQMFPSTAICQGSLIRLNLQFPFKLHSHFEYRGNHQSWLNLIRVLSRRYIRLEVYSEVCMLLDSRNLTTQRKLNYNSNTNSWCIRIFSKRDYCSHSSLDAIVNCWWESQQRDLAAKLPNGTLMRPVGYIEWYAASYHRKPNLNTKI